MNPVRFPGYNINYGAPRNWNPERDGPCGVLPVLEEGRNHISVWKPNDEERAKIAAGANIAVNCVGVQIPIAVLITSSDGEEVDLSK